MRFEWDARKAAAKERRHGITFEEAATCFEDEHGQFFADLTDPSRFALIAVSRRERLLFTIRAVLDGDRIRIVSARLATRTERTAYEEDSA